MNKLITVLTMLVFSVSYAVEHQKISYQEYSKKVEGLAATCTSKGLPQFSGFCLSKKYGSDTERSITVALQIADFENFYQSCEHDDFPNARDQLNRALNIEDTKRFYDEIAPQKEAIETYASYSDACKTTSENNVLISKKLKWLDYMASQYPSRQSDKQAQQVGNETLPNYYVGTFEDTVPQKIGGKTPNTKFTLNCNKSASCTIKVGENQVGTFNSFTSVTNLQAANYALSYAKEHLNVSEGSTYSWQANHLKPLLTSTAKLESCIDISDKSSLGYILLCKLDNDPWAKSTVLILGTQMSNCGDLFCRYEIVPLFRN